MAAKKTKKAKRSNKITIRVTMDDILSGSKCSPLACPIARALKRSGFPAAVGARWVRPVECIDRADRVKIALPTKAERFILNFDTEGSVAPFSFKLPLTKAKWAKLVGGAS